MALTVFLFLLTVFQYAPPSYVKAVRIPDFYNFFTINLAILGAYVGSLWTVLLPVIAALPAGDSIAIDRRRGVDAVMITRVGWHKYIGGRLLGTGALAGTAVLIPMGIIAIITAIAYPIGLPKFLGWKVQSSLPYSVKISGVFGRAYWPTFDPHFFWSAPGVYLVFAFLLALWATVTIATWSVASSPWLRRPILTLALPVVLFWTISFVANGSYSGLAPTTMAGGYLSMSASSSWLDLIIYWGVPAAAAVGCLVWGAVRQREWPQRSVGR